ncbi:SH2 domain-containing protein 2A isoform X6 [Rhinopithecus roxellana]|uniref:SH2 domain-containing protein 2A isoform X6 n=1 Tax=Rhinopithecus roxellana TaxID=61622 RepID=UPI0012371055|nr:SH2 domain-containing protein 2A isoform X6 [Rhinopithecus roxellana]
MSVHTFPEHIHTPCSGIPCQAAPMEFPLAQICPQGSHEAPIPTFSTFQTMDTTHRSCRNLGYTAASPQALEAASIPGNAERAEEVPGEGSLSLQAETRAWFQKTQAHWLLQHGAAPAWFHGFITRREAERLLEPKPQGCYLVRFSESAVTFVLTYRSRTCCRHFLLAQLRDGRHVVLGEDSAHERLQDLLRHYTAHPLSPYGETLTEPLARQQTPEPAGLPLRTEESNSGSKSQDPNPEYSPVIKQGQATVPMQKEVAGEKEPSNPIYNEPDEPIAFYAMGRGSPGEAPSNIYVEVEDEGPPTTLGHPVLRKSRSRPVPGGQVRPDPQQRSLEVGEANVEPLPPKRSQESSGSVLDDLRQQSVRGGPCWLPLSWFLLLESNFLGPLSL